MKDEKFFEIVNSELKAYFLGLLYADGYNSSKTKYPNSKKGKSVGISLIDKNILVLLQEKIGGSLYLINKKRYSKNYNDAYSLNIYSKKFSEDLDNLGCVRNKTKVLLFPTTDIIPEQLQKHFIRGYFDGDGSVWEGKRKKIIVKDKTRKTGFRERIIHNVKFNITGTISMMNGIQDILVNKLKFKKTKINTSKNIENCVQLEYSGRRQMKVFYDYIYSDSNYFIERKKLKFEEIINRANI